MHKRNRLIAMAIGLFALVAVYYGCQTQDGSFPTEADRSIELSATPEEAEAIFDMIADIITDPTLGKSAKKQFTNVVRTFPRNPADGIAKAESLIAFIFKHYQAGKWVDPQSGPGTGDLIAAIGAYVGENPATDAAEACIPNVDCQLVATEDNEFAGTQIPGDMITQPFVIYLIAQPDISVEPPIYGLVFEIATIPEGITFPPASPSGSLSLAAEDDQPVAAVCTLEAPDPLGIPAGTDPSRLFLVHLVDGVWVRQLPQVEVTFLDCSSASSEIESASHWAGPLEFVFSPVLEFLSPQSAHAIGKSTGGAITAFSPHATELVPPFPTTTTVSIVEGGTSFTAGQTLTLRAVVDPAPDGGNVLFYATSPVSGPGAPVVPVVDGVATFTFTCGSARVPFGSHTAQVQYMGSSNFEGSVSNQIAYTCLEG